MTTIEIANHCDISLSRQAASVGGQYPAGGDDHSPYPSFLSQAQESLVIQFFASASVAKSLTCISGRSGNVMMTSHPGPAFMGRGSNLILATDLIMVAICARSRKAVTPA
jgi:hypothetical protein